MKILLHDDTPSYLTHGGKQVLVQKLYENLRAIGVDVEYARWWDPTQKCDLIHSFGCSRWFVWSARQAGVKLVLTHIVSETNHSWARRFRRRFRNQFIRGLHSDRIGNLFPWYFYPTLDALVYIHKFDLEAAVSIYSIPREKTHYIPHGCDKDQMTRLQLGIKHEHTYLISTASIVPRKNSLLLARAAHRADIPIVFLGSPFSEDDAYYREFLKLVDDKHVIYKGYVSEEEKNQWLTGASGFVLLSEAESGCIAVYEAAAAGLPLLLSDLPWAYAYGEHPTLQHVKLNNEAILANCLKSFFAASKRLDGTTFPVMSWRDIAGEYIKVYKSVLDSGIS